MLECGSLESAYDFCKRGLRKYPEDRYLKSADEKINKEAGGYFPPDGTILYKNIGFDITNSLELVSVRREIYAWNNHEPDRFSDESLNFLNLQLSAMAPKLAIGIVDLPSLQTSKENQKCVYHHITYKLVVKC